MYSMSQKSSRFRSVHFRSNRLPRANSFSARHEFVCKIHCVRWRSIARLFSTTRSRDGFSYHEKGYRPRPIALFIARVRAGPRGDGSARAYLYFLRFIIECITSLQGCARNYLKELLQWRQIKSRGYRLIGDL